MSEWAVRIENVVLENFKNVKYGELSLENKNVDSKASFLGLYGQNGSGKTALIDGIDILRYALSGRSLPPKYADYINLDAEYATIRFCFSIKKAEAAYRAWYEFSVRKESVQDEYSSPGMDEETDASPHSRPCLFNERLRFQYSDDNIRIRMGDLIDVKDDGVFLPKSRYTELVGTDKSTATDIMVAYRMAAERSQSFIFSRQLVNTIRRYCKNEIYLTLINRLQVYGVRELFVINTNTAGWISMNALPIAFKYRKSEAHREAYGQLTIPLNEAVLVSDELVDVVKDLMNNMNTVLAHIVPGLHIKVYELETVLTSEAQQKKRLQLVSVRDGGEIPLKYESEGIKKIVSILQLLIVVFNHDSITLAVDEIDSGIFEYLLGEILRIISEKGKGQLIFTSHNLRPLETLNKNYIAFTTVNPKNRYIRITNVKGNNNLRDVYYRDITLKDKAELLYDPTNNYEIMLALKEAGKAYGA